MKEISFDPLRCSVKADKIPFPGQQRRARRTIPAELNLLGLSPLTIPPDSPSFHRRTMQVIGKPNSTLPCRGLSACMDDFMQAIEPPIYEFPH
jgi:hypothetical protein